MNPFREVSMRAWLVVSMLAGLGAAPLQAQDFWKHWGDGQAELGGYRLTQPRYGALRAGTAVMIYVTEEFSNSLRVKADPGKHPPADTYPVMKLNAIRHFQTGIYDYSVMTSTFARVLAGWPVAKVSFSSQEWCGHVYQQLLPRGGRIAGLSHSYFDGEADDHQDLAEPEDGVLADQLPILLRGWLGAYLEPGQSRSVPYLPSLLETRFEHKPLAWGRARIQREAKPVPVRVPAGSFTASRFTVAVQDGPTYTYDFESEAPYRLLRWASDLGEEAVLLRSTRLPYWKLNTPGGEEYLEQLGLK